LLCVSASSNSLLERVEASFVSTDEHSSLVSVEGLGALVFVEVSRTLVSSVDEHPLLDEPSSSLDELPSLSIEGVSISSEGLKTSFENEGSLLPVSFETARVEGWCEPACFLICQYHLSSEL